MIWPTRKWRASLAAAVVGIVLVSSGAGVGAQPARPGAPARIAGHGDASGPVPGGTAYFAEQPETPPTYIFPLVSGADFTVANVNDFQTLLYTPLYWFGDDNKPGLDENLSIGRPPVYSDDDRTVTVTLKPWKWSDGETVDARDVVFWMNLLTAEKDNWASYVPGGFPDNVTSYRAVNDSTVQFKLKRSYDPSWFTNNELSQITPLPLAWDRTSPGPPAAGGSPGGAGSADTTPAGARAVYKFLNNQSRDTADYPASTLWSVVDGPWRLESFTSTGLAGFVPNRRYSGPDKARLAAFVEEPFVSAAAELNVLRAGPSRHVTGSPAQISVGYLPDEDLPQRAGLQSQGYQLVDSYPFQFDYLEPNFNNPTVGPIFRQLYFRQAFQHLIDQTGWIKAFYHGVATTTYGPIPTKPANPYADHLESVNPYPFSVSAAATLLKAHGWKVRPHGVTSCIRPGGAAGDCGPGIRFGELLKFNLLEPSGLTYTNESMADLQATAARVGISLSLKVVPETVVSDTIDACTAKQAACRWQIGQYGVGWVFTPDHLPTGEEIFQTGALGNVSNYSDKATDRAINATTTVSLGDEQRALDRYQDLVRTELPDFWQPSPGTVVTLQANLHGYSPNAYGFINPEEWWFG
jgi:peptide/nickel transport system substrate-binding protein